MDRFASGPKSEERGRDIFDATSVWSVDRLAAGLMNLTSPSTEKWHGLKTLDPLAPEPSDEEQEWFDRYRYFSMTARQVYAGRHPASVGTSSSVLRPPGNHLRAIGIRLSNPLGRNKTEAIRMAP